MKQFPTTITRKLEFDYGHRVLGHEGKCANLHGHRGVAEITVTSDELDGIGRVIDFSKIKEQVGGWIDHNWDHNILLHPDDPLRSLDSVCDPEAIFGPKVPFVLPVDRPNPTAENMVAILFGTAQRLLSPYSIRVVRVRIYETPNSWADFVAL